MLVSMSTSAAAAAAAVAWWSLAGGCGALAGVLELDVSAEVVASAGGGGGLTAWSAAASTA